MKTKNQRIKLTTLAVLVTSLVAGPLPTRAGELEPLGPPGPTMKTLDEVEPRIPIQTADLPLTISEPNSYYLAEHINFTQSNTPAITIDANDVTIDLNGFALTGPGQSVGTNSYGVFISNQNNVEIRDGTIRSFGHSGIREDAESGKGHRILRVRAVSNKYSGISLRGSGHQIKHCTGAYNGTNGIYVSADSLIISNNVHDNQGSGIQANYGSMVTGNAANNNQNHGITVDNGNTLVDNTTSNNVNEGIKGVNANRVVGNTVYDNNTGIYLEDGCTVRGNMVYQNQREGLHVGSGCTVAGNTVYQNQRNGIMVEYGCLVQGNTVYENNLSEESGDAGIFLFNRCTVENNVLKGNKLNSIHVFGSSAPPR